MKIDEIRKLYPGLDEKTYLDTAAVGLTSLRSEKSIRDFLDMAVHCHSESASHHHQAMDKLRRGAVVQGAKLLNSDVENIALIESTTHGLNIAANSIPLERGDNVLIADTEFLQVAIPWYKKVESTGIEIKKVRSHDEGVLDAEDFIKEIDSKTRVVCVSSVQWCSGYRLDMKALGEFCRDKGIWLVTDAIQEMGALNIDTAERYSDFIIAGGHKWLNSPFGCGIMYISDRVRNELEPGSYGYLTLEKPEGGWGEYFKTPEITPYRDYDHPNNAGKFEIGGTANYPGGIGLAESVRLVNEIGSKNVEDYVIDLGEYVFDELEKAGVKIISKRDRKNRSGIVIFQCFDDILKNREVLDKLLKNKIYLAMRYTSNVGGLRVSVQYYNDRNDVDSCIEAIKKIIR
ncbi:MAG: aminotransferase class V-fold PLP-dependent enzyme [bacterium]|nr:aminotransferase class V-fold PLP-dependent enzyme [bacterium]